MVYCHHCNINISRPDRFDGRVCCAMCGRVLEEDEFPQEPTARQDTDVPGAASSAEVVDDAINDGMDSDSVDSTSDEESLSDIDDSEVEGYILLEGEEKNYKKIMWEEMNKEYLEELAAKEAALVAARKAYEAHLSNGPKA